MQSLKAILILFSVFRFQISTQDKFQDECLSVSNKHRAKHQAPALKIDKKVIEFAKSRCKLVTQPKYLEKGHEAVAPSDHGENIYRTTAKKIESCKKIIDKWYSESKLYSYSNPKFSEKTAHFTQLVWKGTSLVGCAQCDSKGAGGYNTYVVCSYKKLANSKSTKELKANVLTEKITTKAKKSG